MTNQIPNISPDEFKCECCGRVPHPSEVQLDILGITGHSICIDCDFEEWAIENNISFLG